MRLQNYLLVADANGTIKAWYTSGKQQFGLCFQPRPSFVLAREEGSLPSGIKTMKPITDRRVGNILMVSTSYSAFLLQFFANLKGETIRLLERGRAL
jgi:hypothetical protein